jgi:subtilisin family serine protease
MSKLDPQLEFLVGGGTADLATTADADATFERFGVESATRSRTKAKKGAAGKADNVVTVLAQFDGEESLLVKAGLTVRSVSGDVVTGTIALSDVSKLSAIAQVQRVEAARSMQPELDLSLVECRANLVHTGPPGRRGAGVIVGICDSGCDFTHPSFRRADGTSRILFLWDQSLVPQGGEAGPAGFVGGVEYNNVQINAALASPNPFALVRHRDRGGHGTHVTGIAAGDGSAPGQGRPAGTFVGVAPEADIIVVANASNGNEGLGTSASTLEAVNYIFTRAGTLGRPCVVNMSLGDNLGPHDGTTLLERGLDNLLGGPGRAFVKSAGNAGAARCHAEGTVTTNTTVDVFFNQPGGDATANQIDLWYRGGDTFRISVVDPAGNTVGPVNVGSVFNGNFPGGNTVRIDHRNNDPFNGDRRVFMTFTPGGAGTMRAGNWRLRITSVASPAGGRFDAWIQRGAVVPQFLAPHESPARTISTPGTAREVITAASYVTRGAGVGSLASSSSRGPTRDGRAAPTVAAPGQMVISADGESSTGDPYQAMGGTSMAAPHITGTIALMLQKNGSRTQAQIKACLESTARSDAQTGPVPNTAFGAGKLDSNAAVNCVPRPGAVTVSVINVTCGNLNSVVNLCPSVPRATCGVVSVPRISCLEPSVVAGTCPVVSAVRLGCGGPISRAAGCGPSVIDGCPSTPAACNFNSVICGGGVLNSVVCGGPGLPGLPGRIGGGRIGRALPEGWGEAAGGAPEAAPPTLPQQGFFDYDEGWFDDDPAP